MVATGLIVTKRITISEQFRQSSW